MNRNLLERTELSFNMTNGMLTESNNILLSRFIGKDLNTWLYVPLIARTRQFHTTINQIIGNLKMQDLIFGFHTDRCNEDLPN